MYSEFWSILEAEKKIHFSNFLIYEVGVFAEVVENAVLNNLAVDIKCIISFSRFVYFLNYNP